jgi:hypothetical protein
MGNSPDLKDLICDPKSGNPEERQRIPFHDPVTAMCTTPQRTEASFIMVLVKHVNDNPQTFCLVQNNWLWEFEPCESSG